MELILVLSTLFSTLAALLAWAAKLWWGKEHIAAKDETIKSKEAQIDLLKAQIDTYRELTPMKIREYFSSVKTQLEEYIEHLKKQLEAAKVEVVELERKIAKLREQGSKQMEVIDQLTSDKEYIEHQATLLQSKVNELETDVARTVGSGNISAEIEPRTLEEIDETSKSLRKVFIVHKPSELSEKKMNEAYSQVLRYLLLWSNKNPVGKENTVQDASIDPKTRIVTDQTDKKKPK